MDENEPNARVQPEESRRVAQLFFAPFEFHASERPELQTAERILEFLLNIEGQHRLDIQLLIERYREIDLDHQIRALPAVPLVMEKIMNPLREAQSSVMLGHWLSAISLCGTVCEVLCNFIWEINGPAINLGNATIQDRRSEEMAFGREFDRLDWTRKLNVLRVSGFIDQELYFGLNELRQLRNPYVHFSRNVDIQQMEADAKQALFLTVKSVKSILGISWPEGTCQFRPEVARYLEAHGHITELP